MASIPGVQFNITGASGSQALLSPRNSWRVYVLPRGGYAAQDSTGTTITFDSAAVASRFAINNWIQVGTSTANLRKVSGVGGDSISVQGSAVIVSENDRVFLIGNTQPTTSGGSTTYLVPLSVIRQRDDDASDRYTNSMITTNSDGLVQFFAEPNIFDGIIQDGDQSNQGYFAELPVGLSTDYAVAFGGTVTISGPVSLGATTTVTGNLIANTVTVNMALGVTGWATFGSTVTLNSTLGVTGTATFGYITASGGASVAGGLTVSGGSVSLPTSSFTSVTPFVDGLFTAAKMTASMLIGATYGEDGTLYALSTSFVEVGGGTSCRVTITPLGNDSKIFLLGVVPARNTVAAVATVDARIVSGSTVYAQSVDSTGGAVDEGCNPVCFALVDGFTGSATYVLQAKYTNNAASVFGASDTKARIIGVEFKNLL